AAVEFPIAPDRRRQEHPMPAQSAPRPFPAPPSGPCCEHAPAPTISRPDPRKENPQSSTAAFSQIQDHRLTCPQTAHPVRSHLSTRPPLARATQDETSTATRVRSPQDPRRDNTQSPTRIAHGRPPLPSRSRQSPANRRRNLHPAV